MNSELNLTTDNFMLVCSRCGSFEGPLYLIPGRNGQFLSGFIVCCEGCLEVVIPNNKDE